MPFALRKSSFVVVVVVNSCVPIFGQKTKNVFSVPRKLGMKAI